MHNPRFSIICPAYQAERFIEDRLGKTLSQNFSSRDYEVIVVDDGSQDATWSILLRMRDQYSHLRIYRSQYNAGPGVARNRAIEEARGEWLVFVDCDDVLHPQALSRLATYIDAHTPVELVGYNWAWIDQPETAQRKDQDALQASPMSRLKSYLQLHMDGSLIFSAVKRSLFTEHPIRFASGLHEDVDILFKLYWHAQHVGFTNSILYLKDNRPASVVNSISKGHLTGFMRAWEAIGHFASKSSDWPHLRSAYQKGFHAVIATRLREILKRSTVEYAADLYAHLYFQVEALLVRHAWLKSPLDAIEISQDQTQYAQVSRLFLQTMQEHIEQTDEAAAILHEGLPELFKKTWSCVDLHHSVYLGPDEIRTCCKRFFVNGEMKGDVVLTKVPDGQILPVTPVRILKEKQKLHTKINQGCQTACSGCPFMEFKDWGSLDTLNIKYLSFEYHSVCNLKCTYCSDTYYGGQQARYNVKNLVDKFIQEGMLNECHTIVWGGGEPVVGKDFANMLESTVNALPNANQRVLTNAVKHSPTVERFVRESKVSVTTSIDAGTPETFHKVRGMDSLKKVIKTLKKYAEANPGQVTIKYIFTEGNYDIQEVNAFVELMIQNHLLDCNFQISCDFKHETIAIEAVTSMIALYGMLTDNQCRLVFFDDLLRQRLTETHTQAEPEIKSTLSAMGLGHILADRNAYRKVAIWGAGWQSKYLIEKSSFFKNVEVEYFIDSRPSRIGEIFMDHKIVGPEQLLQSDIPVVIAAVQNLPIIYRSFKNLGIDESRLIKQLII